MQRMNRGQSANPSTRDRWLSATGVPSPRHGFSLLEMITVMSMMSTVILLTGATFHILFRSEKAVTLSFVTERAVARLSVQFRDDVHEAESVSVKLGPDDAQREFVLSDANGVRVRYVMTKDGLARLSMDGNEVSAREDFRLPDCHVRYVDGEHIDVALKTLVIERPGATAIRPPNGVRPLRALEIQARLNRFSGASSLKAAGNEEESK